MSYPRQQEKGKSKLGRRERRKLRDLKLAMNIRRSLLFIICQDVGLHLITWDLG
jgi:hypothetical protein